jgi:cytoskeleton protein RodZ
MGTLDAVQQEQLSAIGTYLSQIRQEQDRSLEDIAAKTYIPLRLLKAIESGQGQPLPEPVFVQGFIRRYADALGLDGMDLSQRFPVHVTPLPIATAVAPALEPSRSLSGPSYSSSSSPAVLEEDLPPRNPSRRQGSRSYWPYFAAAGLVAFAGIALGVVNAISSRPPRPNLATTLPQQPVPPTNSAAKNPVQPPAATSTAPTTASPKATLSPSPAASPSPALRSPAATSPSPTVASPKPASPTQPRNAPVSAALQLSGESWVRVTVDGVVKEESVLPQGTQKSWSGQQQITIESGNAGAVSVAANGGTAKPMGALGAVEELIVRPRAGATP